MGRTRRIGREGPSYICEPLTLPTMSSWNMHSGEEMRCIMNNLNTKDIMRAMSLGTLTTMETMKQSKKVGNLGR